jgi:limonene-1,2-epoxide hydrolase
MPEASTTVVREFLQALAVPDTERAVSLLHPDVEWLNTGLPTVRGKRAHAMVREMERRRIGFGVEIHDIAASGDTVLTDRTDHLSFGPLRTGFWVCGTFTVQDGLITRWYDHFSVGNVLTGFLRSRRRGQGPSDEFPPHADWSGMGLSG